MVSDDEKALAPARTRVREEQGPEALVDAAAVASNFERMVRIADATGIPLDSFLDAMTVDLRAELKLARFESTANTP
jgi:predicted transcriptional regulator